MKENEETPPQEEVVIQNQDSEETYSAEPKAEETPPAEPIKEEPKLDYNLEHRQFIEDNEIELKKVPLAIRKKMGIMPMLLKKYKNNPIPANKNVIIKTDIAICDMLQNWREEDYPDNYVEPKKKEEKPPIEPTLVDIETPASLNEVGMEKSIKQNLFDGNKIKISVLKGILKKTPNYPQQVVGNLTLEKGFLTDYYKIV